MLCIETRRGMGCFVAETAGAKPRLARTEKRRRLDELYAALVTSAGMMGISEREAVAYLAAKAAETGNEN